MKDLTVDLPVITNNTKSHMVAFLEYVKFEIAQTFLINFRINNFFYKNYYENKIFFKNIFTLIGLLPYVTCYGTNFIWRHVFITSSSIGKSDFYLFIVIIWLLECCQVITSSEGCCDWFYHFSFDQSLFDS